MLAELGYLGCNHGLAIGLKGIVGEIFLVIIFSHIELVEPGHFGDDGFIPDMLVIQLFNELFYCGLLPVVVIEDRRALLRPRVGSLTVERGWVVDGKEHVQDVLVSNDLRVEFDLHYFGMSGPAGADIAVAGVGYAAA